MLVAYELRKTVDEIAHLTVSELTDWLAFFQSVIYHDDDEAPDEERP